MSFVDNAKVFVCLATHVVLDDGRALVALDEEVVVLEHEVAQLFSRILRLDLQPPRLLAQLLQRALAQRRRRRRRRRRHHSPGYVLQLNEICGDWNRTFTNECSTTATALIR